MDIGLIITQETWALDSFIMPLLLLQKPERVLCIGSEQGFIPAICALACKEMIKVMLIL